MHLTPTEEDRKDFYNIRTVKKKKKKELRKDERYGEFWVFLSSTRRFYVRFIKKQDIFSVVDVFN